jgi:hypothetical protein
MLLSFRREVSARQLALAEFLEARPPAIRGASKAIEDVRQLGRNHSIARAE